MRSGWVVFNAIIYLYVYSFIALPFLYLLEAARDNYEILQAGPGFMVLRVIVVLFALALIYMMYLSTMASSYRNENIPEAMKTAWFELLLPFRLLLNSIKK